MNRKLWLAGVTTATILTACKALGSSPDIPFVTFIGLTPPRLSLVTSQAADLVLVAVTGHGDNAELGMLQWSATGGVITNNFVINGVRYLTYQAPGTPGNYLVIVTTTNGYPADTVKVGVTTTPVPVNAVEVTPGSASIVVGDTITLHTALTDSTGAVVVGRATDWSSTDAGVATVLATGFVRAMAAGTVTITATSEGHSGSATVTVKQ